MQSAPRTLALGGSASRHADDTLARSGALETLSEVVPARATLARAIALYEEALAPRTLGDPLLIADATYHLGVAVFQAGDVDSADRASRSRSQSRGAWRGDRRPPRRCHLAELACSARRRTERPIRCSRALDLYAQLGDDRVRAVSRRPGWRRHGPWVSRGRPPPSRGRRRCSAILHSTVTTSRLERFRPDSGIARSGAKDECPAVARGRLDEDGLGKVATVAARSTVASLETRRSTGDAGGRIGQWSWSRGGASPMRVSRG